MLANVDILIKNGTILTIDKKRRIIKNGYIIINEGIIKEINPKRSINNKLLAKKVIDASEKVILPGLINTHTHYFQNLYKGLGDDKILEDWLREVTMPLSIHLTEEDCYISALAGSLEAIKSGTTSTFDFMYAHPKPNLFPQIVKAFGEIGIRAICGRGMVDIGEYVPSLLLEDMDIGLADAESSINKYNNQFNGRIKIWLAPSSPREASPELLKGCRELANKYKTGLSIHIEETKGFIEYAMNTFGMRELEFLNNIGFLGPDTLAVHCVWLDDKYIELLKELDVKVSHNPVSNMITGAGVAPIPKMIQKGVTVGLGVDGAASNNNQNMFSLLKFTALLHKVNSMDPTIITAEKVIEMATIEGAKSLCLEDEIGSIEVGKKADIIIVDLLSPDIIPCHNLISSLVYSASSEDVKTVIIDGKIVMENREIKTINEKEVLEMTQKAANSLVKRSGLESYAKHKKWHTLV